MFNIEVKYIDPNTLPYYNFKHFSSSHVACFEFVKFFMLGMMKDLSIFVKMGFLGGTCVLTMTSFIITYGIYSLTNTSYLLNAFPSDSAT